MALGQETSSQIQGSCFKVLYIVECNKIYLRGGLDITVLKLCLCSFISIPFLPGRLRGFLAADRESTSSSPWHSWPLSGYRVIVSNTVEHLLKRRRSGLQRQPITALQAAYRQYPKACISAGAHKVVQSAKPVELLEVST